MTSYFSAFKKRGHRLWWRPSLLFSCINIGILLYLESKYRYLSKGMLESMPAFSSSASPKLNEQIKALQEKVDILQKRFWLEPLEPIWQYRGKYYLGKTADPEDKDHVSKVGNLWFLFFFFPSTRFLIFMSSDVGDTFPVGQLRGCGGQEGV
jgi:hypothetical protein